MKKMKKILYFFVAASFALSLASCNDWLKETPRTALSLDDIHGEVGMRALLTGAYVPLKSTIEQSSNLDFAGTDEHKVASGSNNVNATTLDRYEAINSSFKVVENAWINYYSCIQSCNIAINRTTREPGIRQEVKNNIIAQARFIRAYAYFKLVQFFGAVPLVTEETEAYDNVTLSLGRSPINDIYDQIVSDLLFASTEGYLADTPSDAKPCRYAAMGLLAKVYLTMGTSKARFDWNTDLENSSVLSQYKDLPLEPEEYYRRSFNLTTAIINSGLFRLNPVYLDNFSIHIQKKFTNGESIWELPYSNMQSYGSNWSKLFGNKINGGNTYQYSAMGGRRLFTPVPNFWGFFRQGDLRRRWVYSEQIIAYLTSNNPYSGVNEKTHGNHTILEGMSESQLQGLYDGSTYAETTKNTDDLNGRCGAVKYRWGNIGYDDQWKELMADAPTDNLATNVVVLRYADIILMYVEADMLLQGGTPGNPGFKGASQKSIDLMNELLYRARGNRTVQEMYDDGINIYGDVTPTPITVPNVQSECLQDYTVATFTFGDLMRERACELCFEFHRWGDLVRWGVLAERYATRISNSTNPPVRWKNYLFPVPLRETQATHDKQGLYQNPGY